MSALLAEPYVTPRAGLGDLPDRLRAGPCTIAYMGASVTAQKDGYRPRLHELLCRASGHDHRAVAAGLGAMGAITGVFLMDELVLPHRPDLAFVEYATSDVVGTTPPGQLGAVLEGIVSKLRETGCEPCFLYLHRADTRLGASGVVETYERVAERHGVPSINVAEWLRAGIAEGRVDGGSILRDLVHTTDAGSELTAAAILEGLGHIQPGPPPTRRALLDDAFRTTRVEPATPALAAGGPCSEGRFRLVYPYVAIDRTGTLRFTCRGELAGLLVVVGPHSGYIEVEAGGTAGEYLLWDEWCSYERLASVILDPSVPAGVEIRIRVTDRPVDYSGAKRPVDPEQAAHTRLQLAGLMVRP